MMDVGGGGGGTGGGGRGDGDTPSLTLIPALSQVGSRVVWLGRYTGTIAFVGPTDFGPGEWLGIRLDKSVGDSDGSSASSGKRYFDAGGANRGVFLQASQVVRDGSLKPLDQVEFAAHTIGAWVRSHQDRRRFRHKQNMQTWNRLDNHYEEVNVKRGKKVADEARRLAQQFQGAGAKNKK